MSSILPRTLFGQTLLALLAGIGLAVVVGGWIYASARLEAVRAVGALAAAERIVNLSRMVAEAPAEWRSRLAQGSSDATFRVGLSSRSPALTTEAGEADAAGAIAVFMQDALPGMPVQVSVRAAADAGVASGGGGSGGYRGPGYGGGPGMGRGSGPHRVGEAGPGMGMMRGPLGRAAMSWRGLEAAVQIEPGQWLTFSTSLPEVGPTLSPRLFVALAVSIALIALLTAWTVRRMTAPLRDLSAAAERFGRDVDAPALPMAGTTEVQRAAAAFNQMQSRLRRLIENRTLMLAAISHDLRTQLTLLRLRAEGAETADDRARMLSTIANMDAMLTATLSFARDEAASEARKRIDLGALVTSIADDMADAGLPVTATDVAAGLVIEVKPMALRRALTNLIENAVKYGACARVSLQADPGCAIIRVDDDGPGIAEDQLARVLQPFVRLDESRNSETGGIGLGLAIAASIAEAHAGRLHLANRPEGGLRASLDLPLQPVAAPLT
jgi:signal transduction histidine kinase